MTSDHLVGRSDEIRSLVELLDELDRGRWGAVDVVGEPGIGKTRLLTELARHAEERGHRVLAGSGSELERDLPFSVFVDALDEYLEGLGPDGLSDLGPEVKTELAHVFPALSSLSTDRQGAVQHERYRAHRAARALLDRLAESKPLVLLLDDLQWADSASIELLDALLRRPPSRPVLMAVGRRRARERDRLGVALDRANRAGSVARLEVGALSREEAGELLGATVADHEASVLYQESGGNPFYLEQLARTRERRPGTRPSAGEAATGTGVPPAVATSLGEEIALLSDTGRLVLEGAAVAGDPFEPELAAAAAAMSESATAEGIDELLQRDLLRATDVPRRFRFRHPLVRRAVYEGSSAVWRLGAHERCARTLSARGATHSERAHHIELSARQGDQEAVDLLRQAGRAAARLAPASASRWFAAALRLLPPGAPAQERIELLLSRAGALTAVGHFTDARRALSDALRIVPEDAHELGAGLARACAAVEGNLGRHEDAHRRLAGALQGLPDQSSPVAVDLRIELAMNAFWRSRFDLMQEAAAGAVETASRLGDAPLLAAALAVLALAESMSGTAGRAESDRSDAAAVVDRLTDDQLARRLDAAAWLAGAELYLDRYADADVHAERALTVGRATGQGEQFLVLVQILGRVWYVRGRLAEAADLLDGGIEAARLLANTQALVWNLFNRSVVALAAGEVELALATAQESVDLSRGLDPGFHSAWAAVRLASVLLETGRPEAAVDLLVGSAGGENLGLIPGSWRAYCLELLTRCSLALDRRAGAERAVAHARTWASAVQLPLAAAWADRAAAEVELYSGNVSVASRLALTSAATADEAGAPLEAALSRVVAGRALARAGMADRATEELQQAAECFEACGALRYRDRAEQELRTLGHRIHRRSGRGAVDGSGLETLTERELQVARLVVDRRTNPEIAAELFLSRKTVETHLRNIFHKVGVTSRVELARAVERADRAAERTLA